MAVVTVSYWVRAISYYHFSKLSFWNAYIKCSHILFMLSSGGSIAVVTSMKIPDGEIVSFILLFSIQHNVLTIYNFNTTYFNIELNIDAFINQCVYHTKPMVTNQRKRPCKRRSIVYMFLCIFIFGLSTHIISRMGNIKQRYILQRKK